MSPTIAQTVEPTVSSDISGAGCSPSAPKKTVKLLSAEECAALGITYTQQCAYLKPEYLSEGDRSRWMLYHVRKLINSISDPAQRAAAVDDFVSTNNAKFGHGTCPQEDSYKMAGYFKICGDEKREYKRSPGAAAKAAFIMAKRAGVDINDLVDFTQVPQKVKSKKQGDSAQGQGDGNQEPKPATVTEQHRARIAREDGTFLYLRTEEHELAERAVHDLVSQRINRHKTSDATQKMCGKDFCSLVADDIANNPQYVELFDKLYAKATSEQKRVHLYTWVIKHVKQIVGEENVRYPSRSHKNVLWIYGIQGNDIWMASEGGDTCRVRTSSGCAQVNAVRLADVVGALVPVHASVPAVVRCSHHATCDPATRSPAMSDVLSLGLLVTVHGSDVLLHPDQVLEITNAARKSIRTNSTAAKDLFDKYCELEYRSQYACADDYEYSSDELGFICDHFVSTHPEYELVEECFFKHKPTKKGKEKQRKELTPEEFTKKALQRQARLEKNAREMACTLEEYEEYRTHKGDLRKTESYLLFFRSEITRYLNGYCNVKECGSFVMDYKFTRSFCAKKALELLEEADRTQMCPYFKIDTYMRFMRGLISVFRRYGELTITSIALKEKNDREERKFMKFLQQDNCPIQIAEINGEKRIVRKDTGEEVISAYDCAARGFQRGYALPDAMFLTASDIADMVRYSPDITEQTRRIKSAPTKEERSRLKKLCKAVTPGEYAPYGIRRCFTKFGTGFVAVDIDLGKQKPGDRDIRVHMKILKSLISKSPYVFMVNTTWSGGLHVWFRVENWTKEAYLECTRICKRCGAVPDDACGHRERKIFLYHDPYAYVNKSAIELKTSDHTTGEVDVYFPTDADCERMYRETLAYANFRFPEPPEEYWALIQANLENQACEEFEEDTEEYYDYEENNYEFIQRDQQEFHTYYENTQQYTTVGFSNVIAPIF